MKLKSFTLMEVLIASLIFTGVVVISVSSFAMIRNSNNKVEDITATNQCARQLEDVISSQIKSSNFGKRIMGITRSGGGYVFNEITEGTVNKDYDGVALFTKKGTYSLILKNEEPDGTWAYKIKPDVVYTDDKLIANNKPANATGSELMITGDCSAFSQDKVFEIAATKTSGGDSNVYTVIVDDKLYRHTLEDEESAKDRNSFSVMHLNATNSAGKI